MSRIVLVPVLVLAAMRMPAHHAFAAEYDVSRRVSVSGIVTSFQWINPHAWVWVEGKDDMGDETSWGFEMGSPNGLLNRGWTQTDLKAGDRVTVEGFRAKDGRRVANATNITLADGRKLFGGFPSTPGAPRK
jgi:hypothetical protein